MTYSSTTITVQGNEQEVLEVYTDETKEQTLCFCFSEEHARLIAAAPTLLAACEKLLGRMEPYYAIHKEVCLVGKECPDKRAIATVKAAITAATE